MSESAGSHFINHLRKGLSDRPLLISNKNDTLGSSEGRGGREGEKERRREGELSCGSFQKVRLHLSHSFSKLTHDLLKSSDLVALLLQVVSLGALPLIRLKELPRIPEANLLLKVLIQFAIVFALLFSRFLLVWM